MSEKFRRDRKIGFQNMLYTKCINVIVDSIGPSIILRSIFAYWKILHSFCCLLIFFKIDSKEIKKFHQSAK